MRRAFKIFENHLILFFQVLIAALSYSPIVIYSMGFWMSLYYIWWFVVLNSFIIFWIMII